MIRTAKVDYLLREVSIASADNRRTITAGGNVHPSAKRYRPRVSMSHGF